MNRKASSNVLKMLFIICLLFLCTNLLVQAEEQTGEVNVSVPASVHIVMNEDGTNAVSGFYVNNQSPVPITLKSIEVEKKTDWDLVETGTFIAKDKKQMVLNVGGFDLGVGTNQYDMEIKEASSQILPVSVERGVWGYPISEETVFGWTMVYEVGKKSFLISFVADGIEEPIDSISAMNGENVSLPIITREGYDFLGWQDEVGKIHTNSYVMPMKSVTLTAVWEVKQETAFAIYSQDDHSLRFYKSLNIPEVGEIYRNLTVTDIWTGFEEEVYQVIYNPSETATTPWHEYSLEIKNVVIEDEISPVSTAMWFHNFRNCNQFSGFEKINGTNLKNTNAMFRFAGYNTDSFIVDLSELDVSNVENMTTMFIMAGYSANVFQLIGLDSWNVESVIKTNSMFAQAGYSADEWSIGDLSTWNFCNLTNFSSMFNRAGYSCQNWNVGDLSNWNTAKVQNMSNLFYYAGYNAKTWFAGDLSGWDTGQATNMLSMFEAAAYSADEWNIGDVGLWNTENVKSMHRTLNMAGHNASYSLDLTKWDIVTVKASGEFNGFIEYGQDSKVKIPYFVDKTAPVLELSTQLSTDDTNPTVVNVSEYTIAGYAMDDYGIEYVIVNGNTVSVSDDGFWSKTIQLNENELIKITIVVKDEPGYYTTGTYYVLYNNA